MRFCHFLLKMFRNKLCIEDFIGTYRSEYCLWRVKSKEYLYHDKRKRDAMYKILIEKLKETYSSVTKSMVVKKKMTS